MAKRQKHSAYTFRKGSRIRGVTAQQAGEALADLHNEVGSLTPAVVVTAATPPSSPLHGAFEWRDSIAAHQHRLNQAMNLMRSVEVIEVTHAAAGETVTTSRPVFIHVPKAESYKTLDTLDADELASAIAEAMGKRDGLQRFIEHLKRRMDANPDLADRSAALHVALESLSACKMALAQAVM